MADITNVFMEMMKNSLVGEDFPENYHNINKFVEGIKSANTL
jgi:hypothetical protein